MDVDRTIEFLLAQHVLFDERQMRFEEWQLRSQEQFDRAAVQQEQTSKEVQTIAGVVHVLIRAVKVAAVEIGLPVKDLPPTCPYSLEQILDESFLPK
jgi:sugar diacid utilization regulator